MHDPPRTRRAALSQSSTLSLGMDVPTDAMAVADVAPAPGAEVTSLGTIGTRQGDRAQLLRRRPAPAQPRLFVDDAGPGGSWLDRDLTPTGDACGGWRSRCCPNTRGLSDGGGPTPPPPLVWPASGRAVHAPPDRLQRRAPALPDPGNAWRGPPGVDALPARRGVQGPGAVTLGAARGDRTRGETPRALLTCVGLLPAASAARAPRRPGARPTAGHAPARSALGAGAGACRDPAKVRRPRHLRRDTPPTVLPARRWNAQVRRCQRDRRLVSRGHHPTGVTVAMARALAGCLWALATPVPVTPSSPDA
jgi:hypothetical protein